MKKFTLLFASLLCVAYIAVAQLKLYVYQNDGTRTEFVASTVDSIAFSTITDGPDQPDDPIKPVDPTNGYEYVDLGLPSGTLWATMNVGADSPEDYGDYFAWGETKPKEVYNWSTYKWCNGSSTTLTKYCTYSSYGTVDKKGTLDLADDAANANWGGNWRMPTEVEQDELSNTSYTTWIWTTQNGVKGYKVTSKINGNSIFLPAAGYRGNSDLSNAGSSGNYWSSSLYTDVSNFAYDLYFNSDNVYSSYGSYGSRHLGQSVRPVLRDVEFTFTVMFDGNGGEGTMPAIDGQHDDRVKIPASTFTRDGYYFVGWNTKANGTGTSYSVGESIILTADLTLYAQWEKLVNSKLYFVNTDNWSGVNAYVWIDGTSKEYIEWPGEEATRENITKYGYNIYSYNMYGKEQYNMIIFNEKSSSLTPEQTKDLKIDYSKPYYFNGIWYKSLDDMVLYTFSFNANGGTGTMSSIDINEGLSYKLPSCTFSRSGYVFVGWNTKADGSGASYAEGESLTLTTDLTLYAQWEKLVNSKLYFVNTDNWSGVNAYVWIDGTSKEYIEWPGEEATRENITKYGYNIYSYNMYGKEQYNMIIFNEESSSLKPGQTDDLIIDYSKPYFYKGIWYKSLDDIVDTETDTANDHDYVDLGLPSGTKWATCNVGADSPEEYGDYFAWGETEPKSYYTWRTYKWCKGSDDTMTKYCKSSSDGTVDNKTTLDLSDDAAYVNWGSSWRMPTYAEQDELRNTNYTTWTWTTQNGVKGYKVTSKINGNSIFLPAAGYRSNSDLYNAGSRGDYWSSSLYTGFSGDAYNLYFDSGNVLSGYGNRCSGQSVRPVLFVEFTISFDANGGTGTMSAMSYEKGETKVLTANKFTRTGYIFKGWNTKSDGTGTQYTDKQSITPTENLTLYAQWENGYAWVDLGLPSGTKWATMNVGADSPEDYGSYFAWGETEPKYYYYLSTYKWYKGTYTTLTKYCTNSNYGIVDNKTTLDLSDDAAYVNWGSSWRMPTKAEYDELSNTSYTTWTWTTQNGVKGYKVTSKTNGNSIFLPAAGYRYDSDLNSAGSYGVYWSSSLNTRGSDHAYYLYFGSGGVYSYDRYDRYYGQSVRPVLAE